ncbi:hypothetical protein [Actinomyces capricornis]|uniref:Uncharacterized protein n=1 Tax=Actinomyces capricornis TaxID=2755559 RepID=A0ABM7UF26_9ACTO|nr:hypothetical protein [Actinomyces capricornis]BDA65730.1 hypothetical protein MANAM107_25640 [Actinomyces capricornis]
MTKRHKARDCYDRTLNSHHLRNSYVATALRKEHQRRIERAQFIDEQFPEWFSGIDQLLAGLRSMGSKTGSTELRRLLARTENEALRSVRAIFGDDEQTLNDSSRVLMEIEVLLMEWALDTTRIQKWGESDEEERHKVYGFGKVLQRVKQKKEIDDSLEMPERAEYNIHSKVLHPSPGEPEELLQSFDMQASEMIVHLGRIFHKALKVVRTTASPAEVPEEEIRFPGEAWATLWEKFVVERNRYLASMLASQGMYMLPRQPYPKGTRRVVPITPTKRIGASFFKQETEMQRTTQI